MTPEEEIAHLKKRCRDLSIAFENVDAERMYHRKNAALVRELLERAGEFLKPYEGQDNVKETNG